MSRLRVLWRGPLDSCNYACGYCPFAKRRPLPTVMAADRAALARFVLWVEGQTQRQFEILFTPWGEALIHPWYREALIRLSHLPQVEQVAIQSNGSGPMDWVERAHRSRLALWLTWHPSEIPRHEFAAMANGLHHRGIRCSVGCVARPEVLDEIEVLRTALPPSLPMWLNALRPGGRYSVAEAARCRAIDPHFDLELQPHASRGQACRTGLDAIAVDGDGNIRRCHFIDEVLGNLYRDNLDVMLSPRPCSRRACDCYIGYAHLEKLGLDRSFAGGLLPRIRLLTR